MVVNLLKQVRFIPWLKGLLLLCNMVITGIGYLLPQSNTLQFQKVDITSGLSQNTVLDIYQDKIGFLWFGTTDGLNRFDGQSFTNFICDVDNPNTISNNAINAICEDNKNNLYIGTEDGLNIYIRSTQKFQRIYRDTTQKVTLPSNNTYTLEIDSDNRLWIGTHDGLVLYDLNNKTFIKINTFLEDPKGLDTTLILKLYKDSQNNMWIGTYNYGFLKYDNKEKKLSSYIIHNEKKYSYLNNTIYNIYEDSLSNIWLATNNGIAKFNCESGRIKRYLYSKSPSTLENSLFFQSFIQTSKGDLFVGSGDFGMYKYDYEKDSFSPFSVRKNESGQLSGKSYLSMYEDKSGVLWLGTRNEGLLRINLYKKPFEWITNIEGNKNSIIDNNIFVLTEDDEQNLWIGTQQGISIWNRKNNTFKHLRPDKNNANTIKSNRIWAIFEDSKKNIWIGTSDGVDVYNSKSKTFKHYFTDYVSENQLPENEILDFCEDSSGQIWIATSYGLSRYNVKENIFNNYYYSDKDPTSIPANTIWALHVDSKNRIWIATANGLAKYVPAKDYFKRYNIGKPNNASKAQQEVYSIEEDENGALWCGTPLHGIVRFEPATGRKKQFPIINKFSSNTVFGIQNYKNFIWFSTIKGLGRLNKITGEIIAFNNRDGIKSNEFNFPAVLTYDSLFFFGGTNGITSFKPEIINIDLYKPPLVFTRLAINFEEIRPMQKYHEIVPLKTNINFTDKIKLNYDDNVFSITFSSLDYKIKDKIEYAYKLDGINNEWVYLGNRNTINFTGLRHGKYTLIVKASNSDGIWNEEYRSLVIIITPPWWETTWFILLSIIFFLLTTAYIVMRREKRLKLAKQRLEENVHGRTQEIESQKEEIESQKELIEKQNEALRHHTLHLEEEVEKRIADLIIARDKAEEADRLKSAFLSNMSHEIRTPLNAIIGFSELLGDHDVPKEEQGRFLDIIKNNSNDLLNLFNTLIDISVIQSKKLSLSKSLFNPNSLLNEIYYNYKQKLQVSSKEIKISLYTDIGTTDFRIYTDPIRLKQVLNYLINNAIKYTEKGKVDFGYYRKDSSLQFFIKDTGIGIPQNKLPYLFNRFEKLERNKEKLYRGTGLGLSISKDLVELMGGKIWVKSKKDEGTNFYFTIPLHDNVEKE